MEWAWIEQADFIKSIFAFRNEIKMDLQQKATMIFLPGKSCDQRVWQTQMNWLSDLVTPICVDLRYVNTLEEMLQIILKTSDEPFILAGFSLGGYVAQEFILKYPEKVTGLVLVGASAKGYDEQQKFYYKKLIQLAKESSENVISAKTLQDYMHPENYKNKEMLAMIEAMMSEAGNEVFIRQQTATIDRLQRFNDLKKITCPSIVIGGQDDKLVAPKDMQLTAESIFNAQFHLIKTCGHMVPIEQAMELNYLLHAWVKKNNFYCSVL